MGPCWPLPVASVSIALQDGHVWVASGIKCAGVLAGTTHPAQDSRRMAPLGSQSVAPWFTRARFADDITLLSEAHVDPFARCNIWHVRGRDRDLIIDTGLGVVSLREAARDLLQRPVTAVLTHSHFDHIGGAYEFSERIAHVSEWDELAEPLGFQGLTAAALGGELVTQLRAAGYEVPDQLLSALPSADFDPEAYRVRRAPLTAAVDDGDLLDLGDRTFEVLHVPGHSPGSIALWEVATQTLFSGDAVYDGPLLDQLPGSSIADYERTLRRLLQLDVRVVHGGHAPSFGRKRLREIVRKQLDRWENSGIW
jgi:glyoxylase-like metal-dependent hydrolase (beta-lactamase superfamily II)